MSGPTLRKRYFAENHFYAKFSQSCAINKNGFAINVKILLQGNTMSGTNHQKYRNRIIVDKMNINILLQGNTTSGIDPQRYRDRVIVDKMNINILLQGNSMSGPDKTSGIQEKGNSR